MLLPYFNMFCSIVQTQRLNYTIMSSIKRKRAALGLPLTQLTGHAQTPTKSDKSSDKAVEASSVSKTSIHRSQPELDQSVKPFVGELGRTDSSFPHFIMTGDNSVLHFLDISKKMPSISYAIIHPPNPKILKVAIMGAPNAGKSTLLNSLLGETVSNLISLFWFI